MAAAALPRCWRPPLLAPLGLALAWALCTPPAGARAQPVVAPGFDPAPLERASPRLPPAADPALAAELQRLRRAAAGSGAAAREAAWQLALLHLNGIAPAATPGEARRWLALAHALGEPMAAAGLAWCAIDGCDGPPEPEAARRWIAALRAVDAPRAQYLEWLLGTRLAPPSQAPHTAPGARRQASRQDELLERAARGGNTAARLERGLEQLAQEHIGEAARSFESAAARSPAAAANAQLLQERLAPAPRPRARGPAAGDQWLTAARRFHRGDGVPANFTEAVRLYQLAAQAGNPEARRMLALITSRLGPDGQVDLVWMRELAALDLAGAWPRPDSAAPGAAVMQRDPTPLYDLLPRRWRDNPPALR